MKQNITKRNPICYQLNYSNAFLIIGLVMGVVFIAIQNVMRVSMNWSK